MRRHLVAALLTLGFAGGLSAATPTETGRAPCAMAPSHDRISIPAAGLAWAGGEAWSDTCNEDHAHEWIPALSNAFFVDAEPGEGSLRPWVVTVGVPSRSGGKPDRGVCLGTSTLGWRTLRHYEQLPLRWVADLDADGASELLIWDSFPLEKDASMAAFGMMAWVYKLGADEAFIVDLGLSRKMAAELAEEYRTHLTGREGMGVEDLREMASRELDDFAQDRCRVVPDPPPDELDEADDSSLDASPQDADEEP